MQQKKYIHIKQLKKTYLSYDFVLVKISIYMPPECLFDKYSIKKNIFTENFQSKNTLNSYFHVKRFYFFFSPNRLFLFLQLILYIFSIFP